MACLATRNVPVRLTRDHAVPLLGGALVGQARRRPRRPRCTTPSSRPGGPPRRSSAATAASSVTSVVAKVKRSLGPQVVGRVGDVGAHDACRRRPAAAGTVARPMPDAAPVTTAVRPV